MTAIAQPKLHAKGELFFLYSQVRPCWDWFANAISEAVKDPGTLSLMEVMAWENCFGAVSLGAQGG